MSEQQGTRLLFLGDRALAQGFALIGFETWPDASAADLDFLLGQLRHEPAGAFVVIDQQLAAAGSQLLPLVRDEGRHLVVIEVPSLADPLGFRLDIDDQVEALLGERYAEN